MAASLASAADNKAAAAGVGASAASAGVAAVGPVADHLIVTERVVGSGKLAEAGHDVSVMYTGWLYNPKAKDFHGKQFDTSHGRGPFNFPLGGGRVIKGWDQGVAGMKVGGKRTLIIPSDMAYGSRAMGDVIPADSVLIFDVDLLDVK